MVTTVTTVTTIVTLNSATSTAFVAVVLAILMMVLKETIGESKGPRAMRIAQSMNIAVGPLLVVFVASAIVEIARVLR